MNRNVLMLLYWFPPSNEVGSFRSIKFIKNLPSHDWHPIVLAPSNGVYLSFDYGAENSIRDKCTIRRAPLLNPFTFLNRLNLPWAKKMHDLWWKLWNRLAVPDGVILWHLPALFAIIKILKQQEVLVIFATGNPFSVFLLATTVKLLSKDRVKLVLDYRDPWTLNPFIRRSSLRTKLESFLERFVLRHMDAAIFVSDELRDLQISGFRNHLKPERLFTVTNSYEATTMDRSCVQNKFVLVHAGNFYGNRSPEKFLEGLSLASKRVASLGDQTRLLFYGLYDVSKLRAAVKKFELEGLVSYHGRIPQSEMMQILMHATALLLINSFGPGHHVFLPGKFFDYLNARRPILCLAEPGALSKAVLRTEAGIVVGPEDAGCIADAIVDIYDRYYINKAEFQQNYEETRKFTSAYTTQQLTDIFNKVCFS